jgi:PAS domain S-box-containing protein
MRKTGLDIIGDIPWGAHLCQFYNTAGDLLDILIPYFKAGLENNEYCMWVTSGPLTADQVKAAMEQAVPHFEEYIARGRIDIIPHTDWHLMGGSFDRERVLKAWVDRLNAALKKGYDGLRLSCNTFQLEKKQWKAFTAYEEAVNNVIGNHKILAVCTYSLDKCGANEIIDVVRNHQSALIKRDNEWELIESSERRRIEEAHRAGYDRYRSFITVTGQFGWTTNADGEVVEDLPEWRNYTGQSFNEIKGWGWAKALHPEDLAPTTKVWRKAVAEKTNYETEYRIRRHDGTYRNFLARGIPVLKKDGSIREWVGTCIDITERKKIEETQIFLLECGSKGEDFFGALARWLAGHLNMDFVCIDRLETDGLMARTEAVYFNGKFEDNVTYALKDTPCGDVVGKMICCFPRDVRHLFPRDEVLQEIKAESYIGTTLWSFRGKPIGLVAVIGLRPLENPQLAESVLKLVAMRAAAELERKQAEETIIRAKEEWERTFDSVPDMIAILDSRHRIMRVNRAMAEQLGLKAEQCVGLPCYKYVHGLSAPPAFCPHLQTLKDGCQHIVEVYEKSLGGDLLVSTTPILNELGEITASVHVARNISRIKQAEKALQRSNAELAMANKELEAFSAAVSHDLRAPLRAIEGFTAAITEDCAASLDQTAKDHFNRVISASRRMSQLIDAMLNMARLTRGELRERTVNLSDLAEVAAYELGKKYPARRVDCIIAKGVTAQGDIDMLRVVIENLMDNAWKFTGMHTSAKIEFGSMQKEGKDVYFVRDDSAGFNMDYAGKLFMPFRRLHSDSEFHGLGIGLAIVQKIINKHGGKIWAQSAPEKGAAFYFTLG